MSDKLYNVGIYIRLSLENTAYRGEDSLSIENQQAMLSKFIDMMPGWIEKRCYIDNGASGGNFNRQGFQDMMEDVRRGIINLVLVQDLSRFGRNYLETGRYLEEELPSLGCRFVALSDGIDTETGDNDIMPFLNAMNDYYLKNLSDRIKLVLTAKANDGQKLSGVVPYGYDRNPEAHTRLIVDDYAAGIVRKMFELRAKGTGYAAIAGVLNRENILPPRLYYFKRQNRETTSKCTDNWNYAIVKLILHNEIYLGHIVAFKHKTRSYRDNRQVDRDESEWIRTENTHEPIISQELWHTVQQINSKAKDRALGCREPQATLFSKIAVCADCHARMSYTSSTKIFKSGAIRYGDYGCSTHAITGLSICSGHRISEIKLKRIVLAQIKEKAALVRLDEGRILAELQKKLVGDHKAGMAAWVKDRKELERQLYSLETQIEQLYEDKVSGVISAETFSALAGKIEAQRLEITGRLDTLSAAVEQAEIKLGDIDRWVRLIKEKSEVLELDRQLLESLVERIEIGEKKVVDGVKVQDVRVFYRYVGLC